MTQYQSGRPETNTTISSYNEVIEYINENRLKERVKILSFITDEERNTLFHNADLFVTTSLQEGFGRTPVEAAMCNVPVISTKETSLPEATMNKVFYYENPMDDEELANKIIYVMQNRPSKEKLEEISNKFQNEYSEQNISKQFSKLIDEVLKEK